MFSPLILIVISLSLSSFVPSDYTIMDPFRVLKYPLILATACSAYTASR